MVVAAAAIEMGEVETVRRREGETGTKNHGGANPGRESVSTMIARRSSADTCDLSSELAPANGHTYRYIIAAVDVQEFSSSDHFFSHSFACRP